MICREENAAIKIVVVLDLIVTALTKIAVVVDQGIGVVNPHPTPHPLTHLALPHPSHLCPSTNDYTWIRKTMANAG